jgi:hypothetical protein
MSLQMLSNFWVSHTRNRQTVPDAGYPRCQKVGPTDTSSMPRCLVPHAHSTRLISLRHGTLMLQSFILILSTTNLKTVCLSTSGHRGSTARGMERSPSYQWSSGSTVGLFRREVPQPRTTIQVGGSRGVDNILSLPSSMFFCQTRPRDR